MSAMCRFIVFIVFIGCCLGGPIVQTSLGAVEGNELELTNEFLGIPFGTPPIGKLRFRQASLYNESWKPTTRAAKWWAPPCYQQNRTFNNNAPQSEDCLYLNVWQPKGTKPGDNKPVMVFIYGGWFALGTTSHNSTSMIAEYNGSVFAGLYDMVFVTIAYRVNVFGFFSMRELAKEDPSFPSYGGYNGIYDQIIGLKWTQNEIANFGGNPNDVSVWGESAGAVSTCQLMVIPAAKGLFKNIFQESGPCIGGWGGLPLSLGLDIGERIMNYTSAHTLQKLRALSPEELVNAALATAGWGVAVDNFIITTEATFLYENTSYPTNIPKGGSIILANDRLDGIAGPPFYDGPQPQNEEEYRELLQDYLYGPQVDEVLKEYRYNASNPPSAWWELQSDICVRCATLREADGIAAKDAMINNDYNLYVYEFDQVAPNDPPAPHGTELCFIWNTDPRNGRSNACELLWYPILYNETYALWIQETIISVIKGKPQLNPSGMEWKPFTSINNNVAVWRPDGGSIKTTPPVRSRCDFWENSNIPYEQQTQMCWDQKNYTVTTYK